MTATNHVHDYADKLAILNESLKLLPPLISYYDPPARKPEVIKAFEAATGNVNVAIEPSSVWCSHMHIDAAGKIMFAHWVEHGHALLANTLEVGRNSEDFRWRLFGGDIWTIGTIWGFMEACILEATPRTCTVTIDGEDYTVSHEVADKIKREVGEDY